MSYYLLVHYFCLLIIHFFFCLYLKIVDQEGLVPVEKINCSVVICVAAWFGDVRLIDNMEIDAPAVL